MVIIGVRWSVSQELCLCNSVINKGFLLYNFTNFCPISFSFPHTLTIRQWTLVLLLIVHTLWNQLHLQLLLDLFKTLHIYYRHSEDVHVGVWCWKHTFWQNGSVFNLAILQQLHLVNDSYSDFFTILPLWVLGLARSRIHASQTETMHPAWYSW